MMVFITYLCLGLAFVLYVWSYCHDIHYTADSDLSIGPVVLAWLVIAVEDVECQGCFANASRIHLQLTTISLLTTASTIKIILKMPTQYYKNFADNTQARLVRTEIANVGRHRQRIPQPREKSVRPTTQVSSSRLADVYTHAQYAFHRHSSERVCPKWTIFRA